MAKQYHGLCARCMVDNAKHKVWLEFTKPTPYPDAIIDLAKAANIPLLVAPKGVWQYVCDDCR